MSNNVDKSLPVAICLFVVTICLILTVCKLDNGWRVYNWFVIITMFIMAVRYTWLEHKTRKQNLEYWNEN